MPDDETKPTLHSFDTEPATGREDIDPSYMSEYSSPQPTPDPAVTSFEPARPVEPTQPVVPTTPSAPVRADTDLRKPGPGLLVLQWLVYAFWGWTVLALSGLVSVVVTQLIRSSDGSGASMWSDSGIAYLLAAVIVLFVIALICDIFYVRLSKGHARTTGSNVIMIIHAVIFALCGVGALIAGVFSGISMVLSPLGGTSGAVAGILSSGIIFVIYGLTLLRTLQPRKVPKVAQSYWGAIAVITVIAVILGALGPAQVARLQAYDQQIESALPEIARTVNSYADDHGTLPASLDGLTYGSYGSDGSDAKKVATTLVDYTALGPLVTPTTVPLGSGMKQTQSSVAAASKPVFHYKLCVTYKTSQGSGAGAPDYTSGSQTYPTTVSAYSHDKGRTCYDLQTRYSYDY